ncbi:MAG: 4Fe-4S binding protein [Opitutales bacterium]
MKFLNVVGIIGFGFIAVLVVTLLFGRVYCSTVCPLGILQDIVSWASRLYARKIRGRSMRYRAAPARNALRFGILGITVVTFLFGSVFMLNILDPFSVFGKIFSGLARPVYYAANNLTADILQELGIYKLYHVETRQTNVLPILIPALMLSVVGVLAFKRGRLYCNTLCPVGSFLGLVSKFAMYRIEIDGALCNRCAQCALNCKAECIDLRSNTIDFSRCVGCFNCLHVCGQQGIGYRNKWFPAKKEQRGAGETPFSGSAASGESNLKRGVARNADKPELQPRDIQASRKKSDGTALCDWNRRNFLLSSTVYVIGIAGASRVINAETPGDVDIRGDVDVSATKPSTVPEDKNFPISPPGSNGLKHFTELCTACQLCVSACPTNVLQPSVIAYGYSGIMQPGMDYNASFCNYDCVKCTEICPTGAILPLKMEEKHLTQIGVVRLELDNCVVKTENTSCGACAEHCPTQAVKMEPYKDGLTIPEINEELCIGCGACEYICPTRPYRAIYVDGNEKHAKAKPPDVEELNYEESEEDFPF